MSTDSVWDEFTSGEYVEFNDPGDTVTGTVTGIGVQEYQGKKYPQVNLDVAGEPRTLTAWNVQLIAKLRELRPEAGDVLTVTYDRTVKIDGGKTMKEFTVTSGGTAPAASASAPPF